MPAHIHTKEKKIYIVEFNLKRKSKSCLSQSISIEVNRLLITHQIPGQIGQLSARLMGPLTLLLANSYRLSFRKLDRNCQLITPELSQNNVSLEHGFNSWVTSSYIKCLYPCHGTYPSIEV